MHSKFKLQSSFWNNDMYMKVNTFSNTIELQTSKLIHDVAYVDKPNLGRQTPKFSQHYQEYLSHKGRINITLEQERQTLLKYFENQVASMWLRRRWLLRNRLKALHIPSVKLQDNQKPFYNLLDLEVFYLTYIEIHPYTQQRKLGVLELDAGFSFSSIQQHIFIRGQRPQNRVRYSRSMLRWWSWRSASKSMMVCVINWPMKRFTRVNHTTIRFMYRNCKLVPMMTSYSIRSTKRSLKVCRS